MRTAGVIAWALLVAAAAAGPGGGAAAQEPGERAARPFVRTTGEATVMSSICDGPCCGTAIAA